MNSRTHGYRSILSELIRQAVIAVKIYGRRLARVAEDRYTVGLQVTVAGDLYETDTVVAEEWENVLLNISGGVRVFIARLRRDDD